MRSLCAILLAVWSSAAQRVSGPIHAAYAHAYIPEDKPPPELTSPLFCRPEMDPPISTHPRIGVTTTKSDYSSGWDAIAKQPPPKPAREGACKGKGLALIWLVQVKNTDMLPKWWSKVVPKLVLAWQKGEPPKDALHFPKSNIGEGRSMLTLAAREQEQRQGWRWDYLIQTDADLEFAVGKGGPDTFIEFLLRNMPAIGVPLYGCSLDLSGGKPQECMIRKNEGTPWATSHSDHLLMAYRDDTIHQLWPFDVTFDSECPWASQYMQSVYAFSLYPGHYLVDGSTWAVNTYHEGYPIEGCFTSWCNLTLHTIRELSKGPLGRRRAVECFRAQENFFCAADFLHQPDFTKGSCLWELEEALHEGMEEVELMADDDCSVYGSQHSCFFSDAKPGHDISFTAPVYLDQEGRCGGMPVWQWPFANKQPATCGLTEEEAKKLKSLSWTDSGMGVRKLKKIAAKEREYLCKSGRVKLCGGDKGLATGDVSASEYAFQQAHWLFGFVLLGIIGPLCVRHFRAKTL